MKIKNNTSKFSGINNYVVHIFPVKRRHRSMSLTLLVYFRGKEGSLLCFGLRVVITAKIQVCRNKCIVKELECCLQLQGV